MTSQKTPEDLKKLGYSKYMEPYGADGSFGGLGRPLKAFQKAKGLAVDGSVGPATQAKIEALLKAPATDYKKLYEDEKKKQSWLRRESWQKSKKIIG